LGGKVGVLVEVNCETDFVAKTAEFKDLVHNIAMQIAAMNPLYIDKGDVPVETLDKERQIARAQAANEGKPEHLLDRIADGRLERYLKDSCLLMQAYIKDGDKTVRDLITDAVAKIGENIQIGRFVRYAVGETQAPSEGDQDEKRN
jgi:elongation factor Ts